MKMKQTVAAITVGVMLMSGTAGLAATNPFTDLTNTSAQDKIIALQEKGYIKGIGDNLFAPDNTITAAEGIQLIVNAFGLNIDNIRFFKKPEATDYFTKANDNDWYAGTLIIASLNGFDLPKDLDPNALWTREEFTYRLIHVMESHYNMPMINIIPAEVADEDQMTIEYSGAIQRSLKYGITTLDTDKKFSPKAEITRADAAEQIYNALEYIKAHPAPPAPTEPTAE